MTENKVLSREGELIEAARDRIGLSQNAAAREIGISGTRWRQIIRGSGTAEGVRVAVRGGADTVARMAALVGVTASQMEEAGRVDVARKLADAAPVPASAWDEEITGPDGLVEEGEILRWRDNGDTRTFELTVSGVSFEGALGTDVGPEEALPKLRRMMALRVSQANALLAERLHTLD